MTSASNEPTRGAASEEGARAEADGTESTMTVQELPEAETPEQLAALWEAEGPPPAGGLANLLASLVTLAMGCAGVILSLRLGLGTGTTPGPGLFPFSVALIAAVLSLVQIVIGRRGGQGEKFTHGSWTVLFGFASLLAFVALMPLIGFEIPSLLLSFLWMKVLGGETWRSAILYTVIVVVAFYAIFILALSTNIPHLF